MLNDMQMVAHYRAAIASKKELVRHYRKKVFVELAQLRKRNPYAEDEDTKTVQAIYVLEREIANLTAKMNVLLK
jgi:hypothetical protein